jgi:hypothetical protein
VLADQPVIAECPKVLNHWVIFMATGGCSDEAALFFLWLQEGRVYPVNDVSFLVFFDAAEAAMTRPD